MDINEEVQKATDKFIAEKFPAMVELKVSKMIDEILGDVFRVYSDVGKSIKEKIEKGLNVNLQEYDLVDYNTMVSSAINNRLIGLVNQNCIEPIMSLVDKTVGLIESKTIKLSTIHEMVRDAVMEDSEEQEGEFSFHVDRNPQYNWITICFDVEPDKSKGDCAMEFTVSDDRKKIFLFKTKSHWSEKNNLTPAKVTQLSNLEHKIFRLYSAQVEIEFDRVGDNDWSRYN